METTVFATQAPVSLTQGRKHTIFFLILVQGILKMQSLVKQVKSLRSEMKRQRERMDSRFIPDPSDVFGQYAKVFSNITGVEESEMKLFLKEYLKDHLKKRLAEPKLSQEKVEEILYNTHQRMTTVEGIGAILDYRERSERTLNAVKHGEGRIFQSKESAMLKVIVEQMNSFIEEMSGISGYSSDELSEVQYIVLASIIDGL